LRKKLTKASSAGRRKTIALPELPMRAVRPHRWTKLLNVDTHTHETSISDNWQSHYRRVFCTHKHTTYF